MAAAAVLSTYLLLTFTRSINMQYYEFVPEYFPIPPREDSYRPIQHTYVSSPRYNTNTNTDRSQDRYNTNKQDSRRTIQNEYSDNNFYEEKETYDPNPSFDFEYSSSHPANTNDRFKNNVRNVNNYFNEGSEINDNHPRRDNGVKVSQAPRRHTIDNGQKQTNQRHKTYEERHRQRTESYYGDGTTRQHSDETTKSYLTRQSNRQSDESTSNFYYQSDTPGQFNRPQYDRPFTTSRPEYVPSTSRPTAWTQVPLFVSGVKPATTRGPPITNKPTRAPGDSAIKFPDEDYQPTFGSGPDVERMSEQQKRRYAEMTERLCSEIKSRHVDEVAAIPLLPAPRPVRLNVSACAAATPLVVGGRTVDIRQLPHSAAVGWKRVNSPGYAWKCGGSLISEQWVLTAAHCSYQDRDQSVSNGPPRVVQLGSSRLDAPDARLLRVRAVLRDPRYRLPRVYFDTALLQLEERVAFSELVQPACVGAPPPTGERLVAAGWGRTEFGGDQSPELRAVSLPVWGMDECARALGTSRKLPEGPAADSQLCAGERGGGKDTCQGDSGGGAASRESCAWRVRGVTSLGRGCGAPGTPALYARVDPAFVGAVIFGEA